ncbi:hypothetical protein IAQ61_000685 [Plenodomus lingam]|uniref:uncharacterized protein n=1 Tax=Leptosphaeria maculans TaxID=5022 RepID=UPI003330046B|nr:hypothetical protein IAQ61_000685 [Plenodomus lingam]
MPKATGLQCLRVMSWPVPEMWSGAAKTSAMARGADAEGEGQSVETQSVRRRQWSRDWELCERANGEGD